MQPYHVMRFPGLEPVTFQSRENNFTFATKLSFNAKDTNTVEKAPEGTLTSGGLLLIIIHETEGVEGKHDTNLFARLIFNGEERKTKVLFYQIKHYYI